MDITFFDWLKGGKLNIYPGLKTQIQNTDKKYLKITNTGLINNKPTKNFEQYFSEYEIFLKEEEQKQMISSPIIAPTLTLTQPITIVPTPPSPTTITPPSKLISNTTLINKYWAAITDVNASIEDIKLLYYNENCNIKFTENSILKEQITNKLYSKDVIIPKYYISIKPQYYISIKPQYYIAIKKRLPNINKTILHKILGLICGEETIIKLFFNIYILKEI